MITTLDTLSWAPELVTGNAEFVESPSSPAGTFYVASNVRKIPGAGFGVNFGGNFGLPLDNNFIILESTAVPPAPGPGASFVTRATYNFPQPNDDFDPVVAIDATALPHPLLHIIGTRNTPTGTFTSSKQLNDLIKFTYDTVTHVLTGPTVLSTGARVRGAYDIAVLSNHHTVVAASLAEPTLSSAAITNVAVGGVIAAITATSVAANVLTVTAVNNFQPGNTILLSGLTFNTFLNGATVVVTTASASQFTGFFVHTNYPTTADTGVADPSAILTITGNNNFVPGQWLLLGGLTNATFLNGQLVQVLTATPILFTALFLFPGVYPFTPDTGQAQQVGDSLLEMELDTSDVLVPGTALIIASSPARTGDAYDAVSLVTANSLISGFGFDFGFNFGNAAGSEVELYYESHPKNFTFKDQVFTINLVGRQSVAAIITSTLEVGSVLTVGAINNFVPGTIVTLTGTQESFLNGLSVIVLSSNGTSFTAAYITTISEVTQHLLSAANFSLLATSGVLNYSTGSVVTGGNVGIFPGSDGFGINFNQNFGAGLPALTPPAVAHIADLVAKQALIDATTAYGFFQSLPAGTPETVLDGLTLTPGTYTGQDMILHPGQTLTLNGVGTYVFQVTAGSFGFQFGFGFNSSLIIGDGATINLIGGASADNIVWLVDGNAAIGAGVTMNGTIIALNNVALGGGTLHGRAIALVDGAVGSVIISGTETVTTQNVIPQPPYNNPADTGTATPSVATWDTTPTVLTTFTGRYADNRLTVISDTSGNRYLSQTYWTQLNHPEGIVGNVMLGFKPANGAWGFHPTLGTTLGGSIIQSSLSVDQNLDVSLTYLLQPFDALPAPPTAVAWPLHVASVAIPNLGITEVPGFYNAANFTWLRGTKSLVDNQSRWTIIGEREVATRVSETWTIPVTTTPTILPAHAASYEDNVSVIYTPSNIPLVQVFTENPAQGQYYVEDSSGLYVFSMFDGGQTISITYNYVSGVVPVFASLFNVPPIAELTPTSIVLWRDTTFYSTDFTEVTSFSITSNVVTVIAANDFVAGQKVAIYGFQEIANEFLNGNTLTVLTASATQFTAAFQHPDFTFIPGFGFGNQFGFGFGGVDFGFAAVLIPGPLTLDASGSFSPNSDPLTFIWTDNFSNQALVTITPSASGSTAVITVSPLVGGAAEQFDVGVVVEDLVANPPHIALVPTSFSISGNVVTFTVPNGLIALEQVMPFDITLAPPSAPVVVAVPGGFGSYFGTYFIQVTYVNAFGETTVSAETVFGGFGTIPQVQSPPINGDATGYNVYVGIASGAEQLQFNSTGQMLPTPIGTNWTLAPGGILRGINPPTVNAASEMFLNDIDLTLTSSSPTQFTATPPAGVTLPTLPTTQIVGSVMTQFQFQTANIIVPQNVAPTITLPTPFWNVGSPQFVDVARNTKVTITPNYPVGSPWNNAVVYGIGTNVTFILGGNTFTYTSIQNNNVGNNPSTSPSFWTIDVFPVVYTGVTDPDDTPTYSWAQIGGDSVTLVGGTTSPSFTFDTNGVNMSGETLTFTLTVNDGINPAVTTTFAVNVAAFVFNVTAKDSLQLSRSIYSTSAVVTNVSILNGIATFTATNSFVAGQPVFFEGMTNATFLNGAGFTVALTGFGQSYGVGFGGFPLTTQFSIVDSSLPNFVGSDSGTAYAASTISQRNAQLGWSPLDVSIIFTNFQSVKRTSVLDGTDRLIVISPYSVLVYGVFPDTAPASVLMRRLFLPNGALILDAVHTEQDYTLVLDNVGNIWRYTTAPFINTDNPDTKIALSNFTSLSFADPDLAHEERILTTVSFGNQRVVTLSGEQGALLLQMNTTTLQVTGTFELTIESNFVYGADKVQFVRWVNMDTLTSGRILLGTILNSSGAITNVQITGNALTITCNNTFSVGDMITLSGLTNAAFLNGMTVKAIAVTTTSFEVSLDHANYASAADTGLAQSQTSGNTFETLIDLNQQQIIGTFDKSKLRNQFVETGEIMFDPDDPWAGGPTPPQMLLPVQTILGGLPFVKLSWLELRPDLISEYVVQYAVKTTLSATVPLTAPFTFLVPATEQFTADLGVFDTTQNFALTATSSPVPFPGQYNVDSTGLYTFNSAQAGDGLVITIRQAFQTLQIVNNGNVQTIDVALAPGQTYFFQVQAAGLDGTSGFSNVQQITI